MPDYTLSRRAFLVMAGLGTAAFLTGCDTALTNPPATSPFLIGPYQTGSLIIGQDAGTTGLPQHYTLSTLPARDDPEHTNLMCVDGNTVLTPLPTSVLAAAYYPYDASTSNSIHMSTKGPFPVLLYAHGFRLTQTACLTTLPINLDFTRSDFMLRHVASYGCVALSPDLSWLPGGFALDDPAYPDAFELRATILTQYYDYLATLNDTIFAKQLDLSRIIMVGHSTGGGSATQAGNMISSAGGPKPRAYGLIAPIPIPSSANPDVQNLLVLKGTLDTMQGADPTGVYNAAGAPKTLVTIPGANHWGYTNLCGPDNSCAGAAVEDQPGTISGPGQQNTGAAYLAALARLYALGDETARPYLTGAEMVEGLDFYGVTGIQVLQSGVNQVQQLP